MIIIWVRNKDFLRFEDGFEYFITNEVRNELNGRRVLHDPSEVVRTMPEPGKPYMPRQFPLGEWTVYKPVPRNDPYKRPLYIPTDAHQEVQVWALDSNGGYDKATDEWVEDYGYGLHFSENSLTTLGCGRIGSKSSVLQIAAKINLALGHGERVTLNVVEE